MLPIRTILHPTDFSARSDYAFRVATELARDHGSRLVVVHVAPLDVMYAGLIGAVPPDPRTDWDRPAARLRSYPDPHHPDRPVVSDLREGPAVAEILDAAREFGADLIVLGARGRSGLSRLLLGSVAEGVLRRADCPVLIVKGPIGHPAPDPAPTPAASAV